MIDGRGRAKIADFGLAGLAEGIAGDEVRAGTPQYMSPEQHAGSEVTVKSDIYSLGLVLYELFTGKRAFEAAGLAEMRKLQQESTPTRPGSLVAGLDDAVERTILRCIERDPGQRPPSVLAVSAALPGGDPLAAALAAGETPSPEMVADAGEVGGLTPWVGALCFVLTLAGLAGVVAGYDKGFLIGKVAPEKPPEVLVAEAREIVREAGVVDPRTDSAYGFDYDYSFFARAEEFASSDPGSVRPSPVCFWYRQAPHYLSRARVSWVSNSWGVWRLDPVPVASGMVDVGLDPRGRLLRFHAVPPAQDESEQEPPSPDWTVFLERSGVDLSQLQPAGPKWTPAVPCDRRWTWQTTYPDQPDVPIRIEAGAYRGRPVHFEVLAPWSTSWVDKVSWTVANGIPLARNFVLPLVLFVVGAVLARRNLRLGRADRKGALRFAAFVFGTTLIGTVLGIHHVPSSEEVRSMGNALAGHAVMGTLCWTLYIALEPYVRRLWPDVLISWSRLLAGRLRDPMIGRDVVVGAVAGVGSTLWVTHGSLIATNWLGETPQWAPDVSLQSLVGVRQTAGALAWHLGIAASGPVMMLFVFLVLRLILRRSWAAVFALTSLFALLAFVSGEPYHVTFFVVGQVLLGLFVLIRFGLLASAVSFFFQNLDVEVVLTADFSAWYAGRSLFALLVAAAIAGWGFHLSLAGRRPFGGATLDEEIGGKRYGPAG
jgi:serine/threonine-protein kinase